MNWYVLLTFTDGTTDNMYCTTREEARERARYYRNQWLGESAARIGKTLARVSVERVS